MAKGETLNDLLRHLIEAKRLTAWAREAGIEPYTLLRLRKGLGGRTHAGTVIAIASKLRVPRARVEAAIAASRAGK